MWSGSSGRSWPSWNRRGPRSRACSMPSPRRVDGPTRRPYHRGSRGAKLGRSRWARVEGGAHVDVQMELTRIIISENNEQQVIYLREVNGERAFPIVIGIFEATSIDRRVRGQSAPRPLTHDLLAHTIEALGGELQDVVISGLREHTR